MGTATAGTAPARLVGRTDDLAVLGDWLARGRDRRSATVVVAGDAGIGKTTLVNAFGRDVADEVMVVRGASHELGSGAVPWASLAEVVHALVQEFGVGGVLELAGPSSVALGRLVPLLAGHADAPVMVSGAGLSRLTDAVTTLLRGVAGRRPLLLVLEDLHWADSSTLGLLPAVVHALDDRPALVVVTLRWDELLDGAPARRLAAELVRGDRGTLLELGPFTRSEQARQLSALLGVPPTRQRLDAVWSRAAGNPFFAEQLASRDEDDDLPPTIHELLVGRLVDLPRETRRVLTTAAVIGRSLETDLLGTVLDLDQPTLRTALTPAVNTHVLVRDGAGERLVFRHALLAEVAARMLLPTEATQLHDAIADGLEAGMGRFDPAERATLLARHRREGGDARRALAATVAAARRSSDVFAFPEAGRQFEHARQLWDRVENPAEVAGCSRRALLREAAETAHLAGMPDRAAELARQALAEVDVDNEPVEAGLLHERLGRYLWMAADGTGARKAYQRAVELVPADPPTEARARVLSGHGQILMLAGSYPEARALAEEAVTMARRVGARGVEGHALNNRGVARAFLGEVDEGLADLDEAQRIAEEVFEDVDDVLRAIVNQTDILFFTGRLEEAARLGLEAVETAERLGLERRKGIWARCDAALALVAIGRTTEAGDLVAEARDLRPAGIDAVVTQMTAGRLALLRGDLAQAEDALEDAVVRARELADEQTVGPLATARVRVRIEQSRPDAAVELAERTWAGLRNREAAHVAPLAAAAVEAAVDAALDDGEADLVARWLGRCEEVVSTDPATKPVPRAWLATARADRARLEGDAPDASAAAVEAWGQAVDAWDDLGARPEATRARWRLAGALIANGDDRERAGELLRTAHDEADAMEMGGLRRRVAGLARRARLGLPGDRDGNVDDRDLTPRERDVLALVAGGLTNKQIGEQLFIGHRTVGTHVSNLLAKLSATTRSEAAAIAVREGLVGESAGP